MSTAPATIDKRHLTHGLKELLAAVERLVERGELSGYRLKPVVKDGHKEFWLETFPPKEGAPAKRLRVKLPSESLPVEEYRRRLHARVKDKERGASNMAARLLSRDVYTLSVLGLPLYFNEEWTREKLAYHGSFEAIAQEYGFKSGAVVGNYARTVHGIHASAERLSKRDRFLDAYFFELDPKRRPSPRELATAQGVPYTTAWRWLKEAEAGRLGPRKAVAAQAPGDC